jgi:hypothetical protein
LGQLVPLHHGEHYAAFAISDAAAAEKDGPAEGGAGAGAAGPGAWGGAGAAGGTASNGGGGGGGERWLLFDDATTRDVGTWEDVVASCEKGRLQPCVLFYQQEEAEEVE